MDDPILKRLIQPLVDASGIDPEKSAIQCSAAFIGCGIAIAVVRVLTIGGPAIMLTQAMTLTGALIVGVWMRLCADNAVLRETSPFSLLHLIFRATLLCCIADDAFQIVVLIRAPGDQVSAIQFTRAGMQIVLDMAGVLSLYLGLCRRPPPRKRRDRRRQAFQ